MDRHFPVPPASGNIVVIACGKAAAAMARAAEIHYEHENVLGRLTGIAITRYGFGQPLSKLRLIEAAHPVPDASSVYAAAEAIALAKAQRPKTSFFFSFRVGHPSLCVAPAGEITLAEKQELTRALLKVRRPRFMRSTACASTFPGSRAAGSLPMLARRLS